MSGVKETLVRIAASEVHQLRQQARRADQMACKNRLLEKEKQRKAARLKQLDQVIRLQNERSAQYEKRLNGFGREIREMARKNHRDFSAHQKQVQKMVQQSFKDARADTDAKIRSVHARIDRLDDDLRREMDNRSNVLQQAIIEQENRLQERMDNLSGFVKTRLENQAAAAADWTAAAKKEIAFIQSHYRHDLFMPGVLDGIESMLRTAGNDIHAGHFEAAIVTARSGFFKAWKLREKLEFLEMQWETLHAEALETANQSLQLIREYGVYDIEMAEFTDMKTRLDMDYWTNGQWAALEKRISGLCAALEDDANTLNADALKEMIMAASNAQEELALLDTAARNALLASVTRSDIQTQIHDRLTEFGYFLVESAYEGDDYRGAYHMKMKNGRGEEIVTVVLPETDDDGLSNRLTFHFYDQSPNTLIREERAKEIGRFLAKEQMMVSDLTTRSGYENRNAPEDARDFDRIRGKKADL